MNRSFETRCDNTPVLPSVRLPTVALPSRAQVVVVGGGIAGASLAYHLGHAGWRDVFLLEQNQIGSGTTWHSAGQVGQLRSSSAQTRVNKASTELYARLFEESGHDPGWLQCGGLQLATCTERMYQLERNAAMAAVYGVEAHVISAEQCREFWPMLNIDDVVGGVYLPGDGRVLPGECTISLVKAAQAQGVKVVEGVQVEQLKVRSLSNGLKRIVGVVTDQGDVDCDWVVLAGNMWMRQLGLRSEIDIPVYPCEHHYVVTRPIEGVTRNSPCTRDPDAGLYFRALDDGGLKLGAFKKRSKPWDIGDRVPRQFAFDLLDPDWPDFAEPFAAHMHRLRGLTRDDVVKFVNGPEAFTPDNNFIMGQPPLTEGLFVCGGWNSAGIACAGGAGKYAVEWLENGGMTLDLSSVDILRFQSFQNDRSYLQSRVSEVLGLHYQMAWPGRQMETARGIHAGEVFPIHQQHNACFGQTAGWERPLFYAPAGTPAEEHYSFKQQNWQPWVDAEVAACRHEVALLDQSTFAKFELTGTAALPLLQRMCGGNIDRGVGRAVYTGMFNERGTFESDLTVVRDVEDMFYLVTASNQRTKDYDWISRHIDDPQCVQLQDVTEEINVVSVMGPHAQRVLGELLPDVFVESSVPYGRLLPFDWKGHRIRALRLSYVGQLGWELHAPTAITRELYEAILTAGQPLGIRPVGNHAISTMRIEHGFRAYGHELSPDETPLEAGLAWAIDWDKDFLGRDSLLAQKRAGLRKRLVSFVLDDPDVMLWGAEPIRWNGNVVGYTTSACYSAALQASIAMGYVRRPDGEVFAKSDLDLGTFTIEQLGETYSAHAQWRPPIEFRRPG